MNEITKTEIVADGPMKRLSEALCALCVSNNYDEETKKMNWENVERCPECVKQ